MFQTTCFLSLIFFFAAVTRFSPVLLGSCHEHPHFRNGANQKKSENFIQILIKFKFKLNYNIFRKNLKIPDFQKKIKNQQKNVKNSENFKFSEKKDRKKSENFKF